MTPEGRVSAAVSRAISKNSGRAQSALLGTAEAAAERSIALVGAVMTAWGLARHELAVGHVVFG